MEYNIEIHQGDSFSRPIKFTDSAGAAINITGYTFYMTVKEKESDEDSAAIISKTIAPEDISSPENGEVTISVSGADTITISGTTTKIKPGTYLYDIKYKKADDSVFTALFGNFTILKSITLRSADV